ncbi:hypothetical protein C8Q76DRAFT_802886 [Earliella scabrosa]|nr:hypothetical protein C8Q76DRAFT_802886 [Earliella scabrosa]
MTERLWVEGSMFDARERIVILATGCPSLRYSTSHDTPHSALADSKEGGSYTGVPHLSWILGLWMYRCVSSSDRSRTPDGNLFCTRNLPVLGRWGHELCPSEGSFYANIVVHCMMIASQLRLLQAASNVHLNPACPRLVDAVLNPGSSCDVDEAH